MDINTLIILTLPAALAITLSMATVFWTSRTYPGFGYWVIGSSCRVLAAVLFLLPRDQLPLWLTIILANYLLLAEIMFYRRGTLVFRGQVVGYGWEIAASVTFIALCVYFTYITPSLNARIAVISLYCAAWNAWMVRVLLTRRPPYFGFIDRWQAGIWGGLAGLNLSHAWFVLMAVPPLTDFLITPALNAPVFLSLWIPLILFASLLIALSQVIMNTQRLEYELRIAQTQLEQDIIERKCHEVELRQARDVAETTNRALQTANTELSQLATTDALTGAWNRRRLEEAAANEMQRLKRYGQPLSLIAIDIDFFKKVNDVHGHAAGDQVLIGLVAVVRSMLRPTDSLARWGGEEFIVLTPCETLESAALIAERLREQIAKTVFPAVDTITVSLGVAQCLPQECWEQWFARADAALYRAKAGGRNQIQTAPETPPHDGSNKAAANLVQLNWHQAYACGHPLLDQQHRALFEHVNRLLDALLLSQPADEIAGLIELLIHDTIQHFKDEEAIITAAGYPGAANHAAIHRALIDQARSLANRFRVGSLDTGELFHFLAHDVIALHLLRADRTFFPYLVAPQRLDQIPNA
ncbi:diguanylate cyclase [Thiorhodococcus mannitoliphagus]|uniref:diguanylate cyclase n=1 Tax=Thiorhodococcus mannitoliphagus TaxID=329406 RepID=A0A6P1DQF8_9GAMM|nr:diguanylate cyclase [Thiorhodococcus mannitoliphagus]NEX19780.1 diguanylate cyclase [Thiorhodococcus mannitoliphagus]